MRSAVAVAVFSWAALVTTSACACEATKAAYDRLRLQMTPEEAFEVVGCPGVMFFEAEGVGYTTKSFRWKGEGDGGSNLSVVFSNGKLSNKSQSMLR